MASIYRDLARYYDLIYQWKDYEREVRTLSALIAKHKRSRGRALLELGCGTGEHARLLARRFDVVALDLNEGMLEVARRKTKAVKFVRADMAGFELRRRFDVVVCLFSSIGYLKTYARLQSAIERIGRHLVPGGVAVIEPWFTRKSYLAGTPHAGVMGNDDVRIARVSVSRVRGMLSVMDMHYLVAERGKSVRHHVDRHELAMFEPSRFLRYMTAAGMQARFLKHGLMRERGLFVGVKARTRDAVS
jgi:ubiquinone/menaquinone biosynthesis C-methylase UbiE